MKMGLVSAILADYSFEEMIDTVAGLGFECVEVACELLRIFCKMGVRGVFATHLVDIAYKTVELNKDSTLRTKLASIVADADDETGERKYKIVRGMPRDNSFAQTILKQYGIDMETIEKRIRENKA